MKFLDANFCMEYQASSKNFLTFRFIKGRVTLDGAESWLSTMALALSHLCLRKKKDHVSARIHHKTREYSSLINTLFLLSLMARIDRCIESTLLY